MTSAFQDIQHAPKHQHARKNHRYQSRTSEGIPQSNGQEQKKKPKPSTFNPNVNLKRHLPQPITQVMSLVHDHALALLLDLVGSDLQGPNHADLILALRSNGYNLSRLKLPLIRVILRVRKFAARGRETGSHQCCARKHEADRASVDSDAGESGGEGMDDAEVGDQGIVVVLIEERPGVCEVEGYVVWTNRCDSVSLLFPCMGSIYGSGRKNTQFSG